MFPVVGLASVGCDHVARNDARGTGAHELLVHDYGHAAHSTHRRRVSCGGLRVGCVLTGSRDRSFTPNHRSGNRALRLGRSGSTRGALRDLARRRLLLRQFLNILVVSMIAADRPIGLLFLVARLVDGDRVDRPISFFHGRRIGGKNCSDREQERGGGEQDFLHAPPLYWFPRAETNKAIALGIWAFIPPQTRATHSRTA